MEDNKDTDISLVVEKARKLDSQAIANIFEYYYPKIYRYLYYRVNSKEEAEDLTSEVFVRLVKSIKYQTGNFEAWLYRIAKNLLIDYYRHKAVRKDFPLNEEISETATAQDKDGVLDKELLKIMLEEAKLALDNIEYIPQERKPVFYDKVKHFNLFQKEMLERIRPEIQEKDAQYVDRAIEHCGRRAEWMQEMKEKKMYCPWNNQHGCH